MDQNNNMDKLLTEQQIRKIVQDEINKNYSSGKPKVPPHKHDSVDNLRIYESDIVASVGVLGLIKFKKNQTYTLYFNTLNPTRIDFNGFAFDTGATNSNALLVGTALLSFSYQFQPRSTSSVQQGGIKYPVNSIVGGLVKPVNQCSSNLYIDSTTLSNVFPHADDNYIANAFSSAGNHIVTMQLGNLTKNSIDVIVTNLKSGWNVSANFIIS